MDDRTRKQRGWFLSSWRSSRGELLLLRLRSFIHYSLSGWTFHQCRQQLAESLLTPWGTDYTASLAKFSRSWKRVKLAGFQWFKGRELLIYLLRIIRVTHRWIRCNTTNATLKIELDCPKKTSQRMRSIILRTKLKKSVLVAQIFWQFWKLFQGIQALTSTTIF
jgi:hypothetical protein